MDKTRCYGCMKLKSPGDVCEHCGYDQRQGNAPHQLPAGTVLKEQYLLGKVLGQGGFGITYLGWDLYLDIPVAVKEYYPTGTVMRESSLTLDVVSCGDEAGVRFRNNKERFLREAKMLARFSQVPEIVQVRNFFLANNTAYIVMEYVDGITIKQYVRDHGGKLSMDQTLAILGPMIQTMGRMHKAGIVHRDISPDNIMMLPDGTAKLLDFGAVRDVGAVTVDKNLTKSTEAILKPGYAPIEQYLAHGNLGPWTDVYALCATIFFCLTGKVPPASPERALGDEILDLEKELPTLSARQRAALEHGLKIRAEERTASMEELYQELLPIIVDPIVGPTPRPNPLQVLMQMLKPWAPYALAAVLAVCAIVFGVQALNGGKEPAVPAVSTASPTASTTTPTTTPTATPTATPTPAADDNLISGKCGSLTWTLDSETGEFTVSGQGKMPDFYDDTPAPWKDYKNQIKSVRIESGVTYVGRAAFNQCVNLTTVHLPDTLKEIGESAFCECALAELTLPEGLKTIAFGAFCWCPLKTLVIPDSVTYVGADAFNHNEALQTVTIGPDTRLTLDWPPIFSPATIRGYTNSMAEEYARILGCKFESIGTKTWDAEGQCGDQLNWHLDLETGFLKIDGEGAMWDFNNIRDDAIEGRELPPWSKYRGKIFSVSIGDGVTSIGESAFEGCDNLADVHFGNSLTRIRFQAFLSTAVDQIILPENVTDIEGFAFNCCDKLTEMQLPESLERLEENAIAECGNLQRLFVGKDTVIDESHGLPFTSREENPTTYPNLTLISLRGSDAERFAKENNFAFQIGMPGISGMSGMVAEDEGQCSDNAYWFKFEDTLALYGTGSIWQKNSAPEYNKYRDEIRYLMILPGNAGLEYQPAFDFPNLEWISGKCGNLNWTLNPKTGEFSVSGEGKMPDFDHRSQSYAPWWGCRGKIKSVRIESGITSVGAFAFYQCGNLTTLELSDTLEEIGLNAFDGCALTELRLPEGLKFIYDGAFQGNPLTTLVIPDSVNNLGANAFVFNDQLTSVTIGPDTRLSYDTWSLPIFTPDNLTIRGYTNSMAEDYARILGCKFESIGSKTWDAEGQCGDQLFWHLDLETHFLKIDGEGAMWDFNGFWMTGEHKNRWIESRELPPWTEYQEQIFALSIGDDVTYIGENAFSCSHIGDVHLGKSVETIGAEAFLESWVDELVMPNTIRSVGHNAFHRCPNLYYVVVSENVTDGLQCSVFNQCHALKEIYIPQSVTKLAEEGGSIFTQPGEPDLPKNVTIYGLPGSEAERFANENGIPFKIGARGMAAEHEGQCGDDVYWFKSGDKLVLYGNGPTWLFQISEREKGHWLEKGIPESWIHSEPPEYYQYRNEIRSLTLLPGDIVLRFQSIADFTMLSSIDFGTAPEAHGTIVRCPALEEVRLPDTMTYLGGYFLADNPNLRRIYIENGSAGIQDSVANGCSSLEGVWFSGLETIVSLETDENVGLSDPRLNRTFYVKPGSDAERYAKEHGIRYEYYFSPAISGKCGSLTWTLNPDTGEFIVSGKGKMPDFGDDTPWQQYKHQIKSVRIESGVTYVGRAAFYQCANLTSVDLPDTLEEIGEAAFNECAITELRLPDGLKTIEASAFSWSPLKTVVIPDSVEYVGLGAFGCNVELQSVTIGPDTRLNYDTWNPIFSASPNLTIRGYTNSMAEDYARIQGCKFESIGKKTWDAEGHCGNQLNWHLDLKTGFLKIDGEGDMWNFNGTWMKGEHEDSWIEGRVLPPWNKYQEKIYAVSIGDAVTSIGNSAFSCCINLVDVHFGNSLKRIRYQAFLDTAVDQIVLPENVTGIEHHAFNWCRNLTEMRLPEGLKRLEENAISECGNLQRLFVGKDTVIGESNGLPFTTDDRSEGKLTTYPNLTIISLRGSDAERFAREYNIPFKTGVRGMAAEDEGQCGDNVYWFKAGENLVLYGTGSTWLYGITDQDRADWALRDYPKSWLKYDHPGYYEYRDEIVNLVILPGVTSLGHNTFIGFPNLSSIDFGTLEEAHVAIQQCPALEEVHLPNSMVEVGEWMLSNNPNLRRVYIENGSRTVLEGVFEFCYALEEVWFSGKESIGDVNLLNQLGGEAPNPIFYVKPGSDAERYAKEHGIHYEHY